MFLYSSLRLSQRGLREMQLRRYSLPLLIESSSSSWYTGPLSSYSYTSTSPTLRFFDLTTSASRPLANFSPTAATSPSASTEVAVATGDVLTCTVSKGSMRSWNLTSYTPGSTSNCVAGASVSTEDSLYLPLSGRPSTLCDRPGYAA